ncbi:MAG: hypothetical protein KKB50_15540, partial [Planctomycetes bacterium]|nr:hypothetical protein [Planctomycetota bacterium]
DLLDTVPLNPLLRNLSTSASTRLATDRNRSAAPTRSSAYVMTPCVDWRGCVSGGFCVLQASALQTPV